MVKNRILYVVLPRRTENLESGQELRDEAVEVVRTLDWHDVGRAVAFDHFELGARNPIGDLAALVHWREQILLADDTEGA